MSECSALVPSGSAFRACFTQAYSFLCGILVLEVGFPSSDFKVS